jgi:hypothetical protein
VNDLRNAFNFAKESAPAYGAMREAEASPILAAAHRT